MKKISFLFILFSFMGMPHFADAQTSTEKFDLTPKIKEGDSWNMVIQLRSNELSWNATEGIVPKTRRGLYFKGIKNINSSSKWKVTCQSCNDQRIQLKFKLTALSEFGSSSLGGNEQLLFFNTSEYPVSLNREHVDIIGNIIGRSILFEIPMEAAQDIRILDNEFVGEGLALPVLTLQSKKKSFFSVNYQRKTSMFDDPVIHKVLLDVWRKILPAEKVKIGSSWKASIPNNDGHKIQLSLKEVNESEIFLDVLHDNRISSFVVDRNSRIPVYYNSADDLGFYSYSQNRNNLSVIGDFEKPDFNGQATLKIEYPVGKEKLLVDVQNGKFNLDYNLEAPVLATFKYRDISSKLFLSPGMDLNLKWDKDEKRFVADGLGANDFNCISDFLKIRFWFSSMDAPFAKGKIESLTRTFQSQVEILTSSYDNLSNSCRLFMSTDMNFCIATLYLAGIEEIEKAIQFKHRKMEIDKSLVDKNRLKLSQFVDTLQLFGNVSLVSPWYHKFLEVNLEHEQRKFLAKRGRRIDKDNFSENIFFASLQYVGYPYYYSVFKILEKEILKGNHSVITRELEDFYNLPCNPGFSKSLKELEIQMQALKVGNPFPFQEITDVDNTKKKLPKGELCVVDLRESFSTTRPQYRLELEELTKIIHENDNINKINYVVIRADFAKGVMVETPSNDTVNFTHIYLPENDISVLEKCHLIDGSRRILLLDKDLKIIDNNLKRLQKYSGHQLRKVLDDYFESQNQPTSKADTRRLLLVILLSLIGFGLLSWFIIRVRTARIKKKEAARRKLSELELKAIRSQMNPHFIFNAMASIQNLINHGNTKNANLYLSRFARLMRMVLSNSNKKLVTLSDELELIKHYLELEQLRVDFNFQIILQNDIDKETEEIPGMLIQPFVENAVIHGITPKGEGNIDVVFSRNNGSLECEITDDGVGVKPELNGNSNSLAIKLSGKRLELLNSQFRTNMKMTIENRMEKEGVSGTKVKISIPG